MPTYEYACTACGHRLEAVQRFSDDPLTECPECGKALRKVLSAPGIVLKGSGFYKTDSRAAAGANGNGKGTKSAETSSGDSSSADSSSTNGAEKGAEKKDAKKDSAPSGNGESKDAKPAATTSG